MFLLKKRRLLELQKKLQLHPKEIGHLATAELVFPFQTTPLVIVGFPKNYLPLHGPEDPILLPLPSPLTCYVDFAQKAATCNHV